MITKKHPPMFRPRLARPEPEPCPEPRPLWMPKVGEMVGVTQHTHDNSGHPFPRLGDTLIVERVEELMDGRIDVYVKYLNVEKRKMLAAHFRNTELVFDLGELMPLK
jgi:hypothetical protein